MCYRLWDASDDLDESTPPEIEDADLAPLVSLYHHFLSLLLPFLKPLLPFVITHKFEFVYGAALSFMTQ